MIKKYKNDLIIFGITFSILLFLFLMYYPGIIPYDGNNQWSQVQSGVITNAHPFFSTYFMLLLSKIWNDTRIVILFQMFLFSSGWTYICHENRNEKNFIKQIIYTFIVVFIPIIGLYSVILWKDILYSYYLIMLGFIVYNISLKKDFKNLNVIEFVIMGLLAFLVFSYRHNGKIVALLYLIFITVLYFIKNNKKDYKNILVMFLTFILLYGVFMIPQKHYLDKSETPNKSESLSTLDTYITWMFGSFIQNDLIEENDKDYLNSIIELNYWKNVHNDYIINNTFMPDMVNESIINKDNKKYHNLFLKYVKKNPGIIYNHYLKSDALLFSINSINNGYVYVYPFETWEYLSFDGIIKSKLPWFERKYTKMINYTFYEPIKYLYQPGLILYICIILTVLIKKMYDMKKTWYILLPMLFNTLSLSAINLAQDLRYAYINYLTIILLGLILINNNKTSNI